MRKLIVEEWMSLDGFVADQEGKLDFFTQLTPAQNTYSDREQLKFLDTVDTILLGRKTYELFVDFWPTATIDTEVIADKLNTLPKVIISNTLTKAPWGKWTDANILSGELIEEVKKMKSLPGKNIVLWGSISIAQELMKANLIDEYHIQLCPVLTGGGRSFFPSFFTNRDLKLTETRHYDTGTMFLNYEPVVKS